MKILLAVFFLLAVQAVFCETNLDHSEEDFSLKDSAVPAEEASIPKEEEPRKHLLTTQDAKSRNLLHYYCHKQYSTRPMRPSAQVLGISTVR